MKSPRIPESVIRRLPVYLRHLQELHDLDVFTISSKDFGDKLDVNPAQIRKDLAYFGEFGRKGIGYEINYLMNKIEQILKLDQKIVVALVGAGHLGIALCHYNQNKPGKLDISCVFDKDPQKRGMKIGHLVVQDDVDMEQCLMADKVKMAIIAVPAENAQQVAERLVSAGISAILNFAPTLLKVPEHVHIRNTDFTSELLSLAYYTEN